MRPIAFGWIDHDTSISPHWDRAQVLRLAKRLGYRLIWPDELSVLSVADQVRNSGADVVILPAPDHLGPLELNRVMGVADVETVLPRLSFARWAFGKVSP
ncbi:hypothetical protein [Nocardia flavorosea]|uniref:LLM class flavin-dependent oxidoreductase n=1 Tax=Nocardia flavorosea TaxID=53429 RepID=A0A846YBR6_9NOCA|nr:hypothetical protein [Nocardia flavorosea]NKY55232.1 hypothetical protein [Nocardia flavorosea]